MRKVGIVSCYFKHNYGSMLQAYATKKFLDYNNIPNETINISNLSEFKKGKRKYYLKQIINYKFIKSKIGMIKLRVYKNFINKLKKNIMIRDKKYNEFKTEFNLSRSCSTYDDLINLANERYSDVIVGSDQLWLPVNVVADYYTLNWVPDNINKISYSTSFGLSTINKKYHQIYKKFLCRINHLSVREKDGLKIIKNITGIDAKLVCDPTMLLSKDEWENILIKEKMIEEKYILCYFLGDNLSHRRYVEKIKNQTGYKIVSLNHSDQYVKHSDIFSDISPYNVGPKEWINLIKNAEIICTDSFHCTVFSIIFNKIFFNFRRYKEKSIVSTNSRIDSLLDSVGISNNRILNCNESVKDVLSRKIDYKKVNEQIYNLREDCKKWLLNSITWKDENISHIKITSKEDCCGCSACFSICPVKAIEMAEDNEGFRYPKVNKVKCTKCSLCKRVCPILNSQKFNDFEQKSYIFQHKNINIRTDSTSGGFFTAIGECTIKNDGVVYGASFDDDFNVKHSKTSNVEELFKFRKSKYVQSDLQNTFNEIKCFLNNGKLVCFSGTPCQIAGLKSFLIKDYENLILVDIMCHSVPSPLVFKKFKEYILRKMNAKKILNINFRDKRKYGYKYSMMTVVTNNGIYSQGIDTDPYLRAFFGDLSVRPSCYNCSFKTQKRVSDITIWDCFNVSEIEKSFDDDKGTTRLIIQSEKGMKFFNNLNNIKFKQIDLELAISNVKEMTQSVKYNSNRNSFFKKINTNELFFEEEFTKTLKTILNSNFRKILSITGCYSIVKKNFKKILRK